MPLRLSKPSTSLKGRVSGSIPPAALPLNPLDLPDSINHEVHHASRIHHSLLTLGKNILPHLLQELQAVPNFAWRSNLMAALLLYWYNLRVWNR